MGLRDEKPHRRLRAAAVVASAGLVVLVFAGCGVEQDTTASDCSAAIRRDGIVYVEAGVTKSPVTASGEAERADCHDVGRDAAGTVFPDEPNLVDVVAFAGQPVSDVLGVREGETVRVFVAEGADAESVLDGLLSDQNE